MFCLRRLPMQSTLREYFESLVVTVILALFGTTFVVQAFKIPTPSMEDNLLVGDHLLVNKFVFGKPDSLIGKVLPFREIKHGDVIVFKYPEDLTKNYVKRAIGLPGDRRSHPESDGFSEWQAARRVLYLPQGTRCPKPSGAG